MTAEDDARLPRITTLDVIAIPLIVFAATIVVGIARLVGRVRRQLSF